MLNRMKWLALLISTSLLAACGTVQQTENVGANNTTALAAVRAAYVKAGAQKSYRAQMTMTDSDGKVTHATIEYAAPSSAHMVLKTEGKTETLEHILYNGSLYIKGDKQWVRSPIYTDTMLEQIRKDPRTLEDFMKTLSGAQIVGSEPVNGKSATAYRYYQAGKIGGGLGSTKGWVKLWVDSNGLPLKLESDSETKVLFIGGRGKSTIFYTDYGAAVHISAPPI
jgi:outer membrane lipoprotein-sorting protein